MSSRIFQGVIIQMKDATDRCMGVTDDQGTVVACSELSMIGSRLADFRGIQGDYPDQVFTTGEHTYKPIGSANTRQDYAVFVDGRDAAARCVCILAAVAFQEAKNNYEEKHNKATFVKNIISDNILPGDVYVRAKELHFTDEIPCALRLLAFCRERGYRIAGDYLCEVLTEFNVFDSRERSMFLRLQVPVMFTKK